MFGKKAILASEMIKRIQEAIDKHGDCIITAMDNEYGPTLVNHIVMEFRETPALDVTPLSQRAFELYDENDNPIVGKILVID